MKLALYLNIECIGLLDSGHEEMKIKQSIEKKLVSEIKDDKCAIVMLKADDIRDKKRTDSLVADIEKYTKDMPNTECVGNIVDYLNEQKR